MSSRALLQLFGKNGKPRIPGDGDLKDHVGWLELTSFSYGTANTNLQSTYSGGYRVSRSPLDITISFQDSAAVAESTADTHVDKGILDLFQKVGGDWVWAMRYEMKEALFISYIHGTANNPTATATLKFAGLAVSYRHPGNGAGGSADQSSWTSPESTD